MKKYFLRKRFSRKYFFEKVIFLRKSFSEKICLRKSFFEKICFGNVIFLKNDFSRKLFLKKNFSWECHFSRKSFKKNLLFISKKCHSSNYDNIHRCRYSLTNPEYLYSLTPSIQMSPRFPIVLLKLYDLG